jgi:hypothetical protein
MKGFITLIGTGVAAVLLFSPTPSRAECNYYSRLPTVEACTRESAKSPKAKREGYPLFGIRRWCEQWQPQCYRGKKKS